MKDKYKKIVGHYENCFKEHGDNHKGLDWPNMEDLVKRYDVMLGLIRDREQFNTLLDFGCGTAMLKEYLEQYQWAKNVAYTGADLGASFIERCKQKYPQTTFYCVDLLETPDEVPNFDYIVANGVFTEKRELSFDEMLDFFKKMVRILFSKSNKGIAFNTMSKAVDWERDDLFHLSTDLLIDFMTKELSRNFIIRNDYGLYEYTTYLYK